MKQDLLRKTTEYLNRWLDNMFGAEVDQERFALSFEVDKEAGSTEIKRFVSTEEYSSREASEDEGDYCGIPWEDAAEEAMWNVFSRGWKAGRVYVLTVAGKTVHCESYKDLKTELMTVYRIAWDLFVTYEDQKPVTVLTDIAVEEAWRELADSFEDEHTELFKRLGWTDVPARA